MSEIVQKNNLEEFIENLNLDKEIIEICKEMIEKNIDLDSLICILKELEYYLD